MNAGYLAPLIVQQTDGSALSNSTTETSIIAAAQKITLANQWLSMIGDTFQLIATGRISTVVTTPGTLTLRLKFAGGTVVDGGAMTLSTTAKTNVTWMAWWVCTLRVVGASAQLFATGEFSSEAAGATTVAGEAKCILQPQSAPAVGTAFDGTSAGAIDLTAQWSVANASNSITCHQLVPIFGRQAA